MSMGSAGQSFEEINVTPLTDVFLVLLVIMILIAPIIDKSDLKIKPPETRNAKKDEESKAITVDVDKEGTIAVNAKQLPKDASSEVLQERFQELIKKAGKPAENIPMIVNADSESRQRDVVAVMSAAAACGIKRMRVATEQRGSY